jgi:hypothetical protein
MKGSYQRWLKRQEHLKESQYGSSSANSYLDKLFGNTPTSIDTEDRKANLKMGNSYAVTCEDNDNYYRVVFLKQNAYTGSVLPLISNPTYGAIPDGIQEVSIQELFRFINFNKNLQNANKAFPTGNKVAVDAFRRWSGSEPTPSEQEVMDIENSSNDE